MKPKLIIDKLQAAGYKVKITHKRWFGNHLLKNGDVRTLVRATKIMGDDPRRIASLINNRGGRTEIVCQKGNADYNAETNCSFSDPFVYRTGTLIALKRLLEKLPEPEFKDLAKDLIKEIPS